MSVLWTVRETTCLGDMGCFQSCWDAWKRVFGAELQNTWGYQICAPRCRCSCGNSRPNIRISKSIRWMGTYEFGKEVCTYAIFLADVKGGEKATLLPSWCLLVWLIPKQWWHRCCNSSVPVVKTMLCASESHPPPQDLGLLFRQAIHLYIAACFLGKKKKTPQTYLIMLLMV